MSFFPLRSFCSSTLQHTSGPSYLIYLYHLHVMKNSKVHNTCGKGHGIFANMAKQIKESLSKFTARSEIKNICWSCLSSKFSYKNYIPSEIASISVVMYTGYEDTFIITKPKYTYSHTPDQETQPPARSSHAAPFPISCDPRNPDINKKYPFMNKEIKFKNTEIKNLLWCSTANYHPVNISFRKWKYAMWKC
jgi:hypothetical protein